MSPQPIAAGFKAPSGNGGVALLTGTALLDARGCNFSSNYARQISSTEGVVTDTGSGGAVHITASTASFDSTVFANNTAEKEGGAIRASGGSVLTITKSEFRRNRAALAGGAIAIVHSSSLAINVTMFFDNSAGVRAGAIYAFQAVSVALRNTAFRYNRISDVFKGNAMGTAVLAASVAVMLQNVTFSRNYAVTGARNLDFYCLQRSRYSATLGEGITPPSEVVYRC